MPHNVVEIYYVLRNIQCPTFGL